MSVTTNIRYNENEEMMEITRNGDVIFGGNYWDFDRSPKGIFKFLTEDLGLEDVMISNDLPDHDEDGYYD